MPPEFARKDGTFMLRVAGESMIDAAILDGDLIVVAPQPDAANGEIVVAMVTAKRPSNVSFANRPRAFTTGEPHHGADLWPRTSPSSVASRRLFRRL